MFIEEVNFEDQFGCRNCTLTRLVVVEYSAKQTRLGRRESMDRVHERTIRLKNGLNTKKTIQANTFLTFFKVGQDRQETFCLIIDIRTKKDSRIINSIAMQRECLNCCSQMGIFFTQSSHLIFLNFVWFYYDVTLSKKKRNQKN